MKSPRSPWWIVLGSMLGLIVGNGPVMQFSFGVFVKPVSQALQAERGVLSAALMAGLLMTGLMTPVAGRLVDRFGIRPVALPAIGLFGLGMAAIGLFAESSTSFILLYGLTGIAAAGQTPLVYCKAVASAFDRRRGLALGLSIAGVGIGTALVPQFAQGLVASHGWRGAYVGLGVATLVIAWPAVAFLVTPGVRVPVRTPALSADSGLTAAQALRSGIFWQLAAAFFFVAFAANGVVAHIVPLMTDRGIDARTATAALSAAGLALIGGRLLAGFLLDHLYAPHVAIASFALPMVGIGLLLGGDGASLALPAAVLVGLGLGAEVDLIAYLQSRFLGLRSFGEIYGYLFAVFMLGSGVGPFALGMTFQTFHHYTPALLLSLAGLLVACLLMARLGQYPYVARPAEADRRAEAGGIRPAH